jgi:hypothetical protein
LHTNQNEAREYVKKSKQIQKKFFEVVGKNSVLFRAFSYQFSILKEIELCIQVSLGDANASTLEDLKNSRKQSFPNESKNDRSLTPSYGYQELNAYLEWLQCNKIQNSKHKKKHKKRKKTNEQQAPINVEEISIDPLAGLYTSDRPPNFKKTNEPLTRIFEELHKIINESDCSGSVFMYGSALFKNNPDDFDLCILNIDVETQYTTKIKPIIDRFIQLGAKEPHKTDDKYGYEENGRYTIPLYWATKVEITLSKEKTFADFAKKNLDYIPCALCYDFKQEKVFSLTSDSWADIDNHVLNTVDDPHKIFTTDPARILRGIRLIGLENFQFSVACINTLNDLFRDENNLFKADCIEPKILIRHTKRLFDEKCIKSLHDLGLFSKLQDKIKDIDHQQAQDCYNKLETYMTCG